MSTDDFYSAPNIESYRRRGSSPLTFIFCFLLAFFVLPPVLSTAFLMLCLSSLDGKSTDGPAPDASFSVRRQWGEEKLKHHFEAADKWARSSTQLAQDIGSVTGVAPIGAPNSFGSSFGESWSAMNLQVIGDKGAGVLYLPNFCADDPRHTFGFDTGSWIFEGRRQPVLPSGKSWLEARGVDTLYDQAFAFAAQEDHLSAVKKCRSIQQKLLSCDADSPVIPPGNYTFSSMPSVYRDRLVKQFADSLAKTPNQADAANVYVEIAAEGLTRIIQQQKGYDGPKPSKEQFAKDLERINVTLQKAQAVEPNKDSVLKLASWRALLAYQNQSGTKMLRWRRYLAYPEKSNAKLSEADDFDPKKRQQLIRRELKGMFEYAERLAKKSPYLRAELGTIVTQPRLGYTRLPEEARIFWLGLPIDFAKSIPGNACEDYCTLHLNPDGRYQSYIGLTITGDNGKTGRLSVFVEEHNLEDSQKDLFRKTPRGPSFSNLTASLIRWKEDGKSGSVSLSPKALNPKRNKIGADEKNTP